MIALNSQKGFAAWRAWITQISCEKGARSREKKDFVQPQSCSVVFGNRGARRDSPSTASTQVVRRWPSRPCDGQAGWKILVPRETGKPQLLSSLFQHQDDSGQKASSFLWGFNYSQGWQCSSQRLVFPGIRPHAWCYRVFFSFCKEGNKGKHIFAKSYIKKMHCSYKDKISGIRQLGNLSCFVPISLHPSSADFNDKNRYLLVFSACLPKSTASSWHSEFRCIQWGWGEGEGVVKCCFAEVNVPMSRRWSGRLVAIASLCSEVALLEKKFLWDTWELVTWCWGSLVEERKNRTGKKKSDFTVIWKKIKK